MELGRNLRTAQGNGIAERLRLRGAPRPGVRPGTQTGTLKEGTERATRVTPGSRYCCGGNNYHMYSTRIKKLSKIYGKQVGWSKFRTLIIEDTPTNCVDNYGNAVYVPTYDVSRGGASSDRVLRQLTFFLDWLGTQPNVRHIEKRGWLQSSTERGCDTERIDEDSERIVRREDRPQPDIVGLDANE